MSAICSLFLRRGGSIVCRTTGSRRYSQDLPQGGLEIPCLLFFSGKPDKIEKLKALIKEFEVGQKVESDDDKKVNNIVASPPAKKTKVNDNDQWICVGSIIMSAEDREVLLGGLFLNDKHIDVAQTLLKIQFPLHNGLNSTLTVTATSFNGWMSDYIQIMHCRGNHWITLSTFGCASGEINVIDSLYAEIDTVSKDIVQMIFGSSDLKYNYPRVRKQAGLSDCGLFAIAFATYLAYGRDPKCLHDVKFDQQVFRTHLATCLEQNVLIEFPLVITNTVM